MKRLIALLMLLCTTAYADEVITGFDNQKDLPVLNEELRDLHKEVQQVQDSITTFTPSASNALSGSTVQKNVYTFSTSDSTALPIPLDNSKPQISEGKGVVAFSQSITPTSGSNTITCEVYLTGGAGSATLIAALFKDGAVNAVTSAIFPNGTGVATLFYKVVPGSTSPIAFTVRYGPSSTTGYLNTYSDGTDMMNGTLTSWMRLEEIKA